MVRTARNVLLSSAPQASGIVSLGRVHDFTDFTGLTSSRRPRLSLALLVLAWLAAVAAGPLCAGQVQAAEAPSRVLSDPMLDPNLALMTRQAGDTVWVNVHQTNECPGDPRRGGEGTGGPDGYETWCFEGGPGDSMSVGPGGIEYVFRSYDRRAYRDDFDSLYWHATTFQAVTEGDMCMWCGGMNDRCGSWENTSGGYADFWEQIMQLELGPHSVADGCSIQFRARYVLECTDLECGHDFAFLEFYSFRRHRWQPVDCFNSKSGCFAFCGVCQRDWNNVTRHECCELAPYGYPVNYPGDWRGYDRDFPGYPYGGGASGHDHVIIPGDSISETPQSTPILLRWRVSTDEGLSTADGDLHVRGFWIDDIVVRWDTTWAQPGANTFIETFNLVPEGGIPGPPWSFPRLEPIYDGWAIRQDTILPGEYADYPTCRLDAGWMWTIAPDVGAIPPPDTTQRLPGYAVLLQSPAVPVDYSDEEGGPFEYPGLVVQWDLFGVTPGQTCDYPDFWVRKHLSSAPPPYTAGTWCAWEDPTGIFFWDSHYWAFDSNMDLSEWSSDAAVDSIQVAWVSFDAGDPLFGCWDPSLPPHFETQHMVDNVSVGLIDAHATSFTAGARDGRFQDTFNTHTCMHTANVANNDLRYDRYLLHDQQESLNVMVVDPDGLAPGDVDLYYSVNGGSSWDHHDMNLSAPDPVDPASGGIWRTTMCDTPWTPGTEILYYIRAVDGAATSHTAYYPAAADPGHAGYPEYFEVSILPSPGARILFVDDFGRARRDYHPCRQETTTRKVEDFYTEILEDLGYGAGEVGGYDKYDVEAASSNQRNNEAWGFWSASPDSPEVGERVYDIVIWTTGPDLAGNTLKDTTQTFLRHFVFDGGKILITGDRIGRDLTDPTTPVDSLFYPYLLGADFRGAHPSGFVDSDRFPRVPPAGQSVNPLMDPGDTLYLYSGCDPVRQPMDKVTLTTIGLPPWSNPGAYLCYEDVVPPYDSLAGIHNVVTYGPEPGQVVYLPFSLEAIVDSTTVTCDPPPGTAPGEDVGFGIFQGRVGLLVDALMWFGEPLDEISAVKAGEGGTSVTALYPVRPNPLNPDAALLFDLAARTHVRLRVYDVRGRLVRTLVDEVRDSGSHAVRWDGRNDGGRSVASGLYFVRMEAGAYSSARKLSVVR